MNYSIPHSGPHRSVKQNWSQKYNFFCKLQTNSEGSFYTQFQKASENLAK